MPAPKKLVFLPSIAPDTFLLMTKKVNTVILRRYTNSGKDEIDKMTPEEFNELLRQPGAEVSTPDDGHRIEIENIQYWIREIDLCNERFRIGTKK